MDQCNSNPCCSRVNGCNYTASLELVLNSLACAQDISTHLRKSLLSDKAECSFECRFVFPGLLFCSGGQTSNEKQSRCRRPNLCLRAEGQEWTPERAWSSVTTEGASSQTPHLNRELQETGHVSGRPLALSRTRAKSHPRVLFQDQGPTSSSLGPLWCSGEALRSSLGAWPALQPPSAGPANQLLLFFPWSE